jgi:hypothetical protein
MAGNSSNRDRLETDETLSSTGGLPPDFFDVPEPPASDEQAQSLPARAAPLPPRLAVAPASPRVVIEQRASLPVVLDEVVEANRRLSPLPATFESLRQRVDALDKGLNALRSEVAAVPKQIDASLNALKDAMVSRSAPDQVSPADVARDLCALLFRDAKYAAAREFFLTLVQYHPNDARLWYYAALANGLTSGDWTGESERMVRRGLACEQEGRPKRSDIDAQFSTLTREQGKDWLEECNSCAAINDSRRKRSAWSASRAQVAPKTLMATIRSTLICRDLNTVPIAPS